MSATDCPAASLLRGRLPIGMRVSHVDHGPVEIRAVRADGTIVVRGAHGIEGTTTVRSLRRLPSTTS